MKPEERYRIIESQIRALNGEPANVLRSDFVYGYIAATGALYQEQFFGAPT